MKVAAYQSPLLPGGAIDAAIGLIRDRVAWCEAEAVEVLCCPEAVLGGLADYSARPSEIAIRVDGGQLDAVLAPLASDTVTIIVGFTEIDRCGRLFNSAAVWHKGSVAGIYRKRHPAINHSLYDAGDALPVFTIGELTLRDSDLLAIRTTRTRRATWSLAVRRRCSFRRTMACRSIARMRRSLPRHDAWTSLAPSKAV